MLSKKYYLFLFIACFFFIISVNLQAISVEPMVIDCKLKPGETFNFKVKVKPGDKPGIAKLSLYKVIQGLDGGTKFEAADPATYPPVGWVTVPQSVKVTPNIDTDVSGIIKVPFDAKGTNNLLLMIESDMDKTYSQGMTVALRYGVCINIKVDRSGLRPTAEITHFDIGKSKKGEPLIMAQIKNTSPLDYSTFATAVVRDSKKKLIEKVELRPRSHWESGAKEPVIYPFSELLYMGRITKTLEPGDYEIRLFYRYAERGQLLQGKTVKVAPGDFNFPKSSKVSVFNISPAEVIFEGKPNALSIKAVKFENKSDQPVIVKLEKAEIEQSYPYSIFNNTEVEIKGESTFMLEPKQAQMRVITVRFAKDAKSQGNYGYLRTRVYSADGKNSLLYETAVKLGAVVVGEKKESFELGSLFGESNEETALVSAVIKNTGNIQFSPRVSIILKDKANKIVGNAVLIGEGEDSGSVLPNKMVTYTGVVNSIKPGSYTAEIKVISGEKNLGTVGSELIIK